MKTVYCIVPYAAYCRNWFASVIDDADVVWLEGIMARESVLTFLYRSANYLTNHFPVLPGFVVARNKFEARLFCSRLPDRLFAENDNVVFLFFEHSFASLNYEMIRQIKQEHPNASMTFMFTNIDNVILQLDGDLRSLKSVYDKVISFDRRMAARYGLAHMDFPYSVEDEANESGQHDTLSDLCFCGSDKGRLDLLKTIYKTMTDQNVTCDFNVFSPGAIVREGVAEPGFRVSNTPIPYDFVLASMRKARCLLEIVDSSSPDHLNSYTIRVQEAVTLKKKLVSNCQGIIHAPFYKPDQFLIFERIGEISKEFVTTSSDEHMIDQDYFSPRSFLQALGAADACVKSP